ncbi:MAG: glycosyltransferase family 4 protein [Alphaproteobacteria bacterium]|nr:glycosyltransferase family 4 protein [Alphaproteobacteria bacterium]MDX5368597.1 glycosyltransferase family 4 protein [Alphaproteobacteria bacterium]MDX5463342.1 glycosyltransferase family 4 protein [Alphaproteobacteria bacterium]
MHVAFHAPMKDPDHPVPSGDRTMARLLLAALTRAGHTGTVASRLRTWLRHGNPRDQAAMAAAGAAEAARVLGDIAGRSMPRPSVWLTYHLYYRAPDLVGPAVARALSIPYVVAEASHAPKRLKDHWAPSERAVVAALRQASAVLAMTPLDRACLGRVMDDERIHDFPPFLDASPFIGGRRRAQEDGPARLLAVGMMREGAKLESYRLLASALGRLAESDWRLTIVGNGPARARVEALFAPFGPRVRFAGAAGTEALARHYREADLLAWPGVGEAYGMVYLEAQAAGAVPVALDGPGPSSVIRHGHTGCLTAQSGEAYAAALARLMMHTDQRIAMAKAATAEIRDTRDLDRAAERLDRCLAAVRANRRAA